MLCFPLSFYNLHVSQQSQLPKKPVQPLMLCWRCVVGLLLSQHLTSLHFIHLSWGPDQDWASSHDKLYDHNLFEAGISAEKSVGVCPEGGIFVVSSSFPACLCMGTKSSLFFPLSCFSHKMGDNSYSIWIFVCCCAFNFKPHILLFCPSLFQGSFKLSSISLPFCSFTLGYSSSFQLSSCKEKFPMLANLVYYLSPVFFMLRLFLNLWFLLQNI